MKRLNTQEIHRILLDILREIDSFCTDHNIKYTISGGTLLGAVRHKGFIPWDEDADIAMPREDFERFKKEYTAHGPYRLLTGCEEGKLYSMHMKVEDTRTVINEGCHKGVNGLFVDIFPLDGMPENTEECRAFMKKANSVRRRLMLSQRPMIHLKDKMHDPLLAKLQAKMHSPEYWYKKSDAICRTYPYADSAFTGAVCGVYGVKEAFPRRIYDEITRMEFEGIQLNALANWDEFLTQFYGDYMTPPPVKKQAGTHGIEAFLL